jgi:RNase P/RNase MRP subunit p29
VYRRILGTVNDNEKENWRILTSKQIYTVVKKPTMMRLHSLRCFGHVHRMEGNRIPKRVLYMNLETSRLRGRPRNRWQDEVREDGGMVGGKEWQGKVYNGEEWKKLLRTARNRLILQMPTE